MEERVAVPCPLCCSREATFLWESRDPHLQTPDRYVICLNCDLVRVDPRLAEAELTRFWDELYQRRQEATERWTLNSDIFVPFLTRLRAMTQGPRLLDIGCGEGVFLNAAGACGFEPFGTEISAAAIAAAKSHFGLTEIRLADHVVEAGFPDGFFDAVCLMDVIEHMPDPRAELLEIHRILSPHGIVVIRTPNLGALAARVLKGRWHLCNSTHIVLYTFETLRKILQSCGFDRVSRESDFSGEESLQAFLGISRRKDLLAVTGAFNDWRRGKAPFWRIPRQMAVVSIRRGLRYFGTKLRRGEGLLVLARRAG